MPDVESLTPSRAPGRGPAVPRWLRRTVGPVLLLVLWQASSAAGILPADVLASPGTIARAAGELFADGTQATALGVCRR
ncbi:ABC transporter permease, partial [Streptomyces sp. NPDC059082]